ncbi:hypothetical protein Bbelb_045740 [Branchiostoma belcheri]|nr:hypothetical protein Bbelb_045740 [Branchiostoma belcheri]
MSAAQHAQFRARSEPVYSSVTAPCFVTSMKNGLLYLRAIVRTSRRIDSRFPEIFAFTRTLKPENVDIGEGSRCAARRCTALHLHHSLSASHMCQSQGFLQLFNVLVGFKYGQGRWREVRHAVPKREL